MINKYKVTTNLAVIHCEVEMVQCMMRWAINDIFQRMAGDHIGIVDLTHIIYQQSNAWP
jgi:hypothetical protein